MTFFFVDGWYGLTPISTIFQLYHGGWFYWWSKLECPEKTIDLSQVTDKLYYIMFIDYTSPWTGFELTTLLVIGTDCTGSCKSNYHAITTTTTAPSFFAEDYSIHYMLTTGFKSERRIVFSVFLRFLTTSLVSSNFPFLFFPMRIRVHN